MPVYQTASSEANTVWPTWVEYSLASATGSAAATTIWTNWNEIDTSCSWVAATNTSMTTGIWRDWNGQHIVAASSNGTSRRTAQFVHIGSGDGRVDVFAVAETPEERIAREEQERQRAQQYLRDAGFYQRREQRFREENERLRIDLLASEERARLLLEEHLTDEQRQELIEHNHFHIISSSGKRYCLGHHTHGNVRELNAAGKAIARYCAQPNGVPVSDAVLTQKLMLESDEKAFLKIANRTALRA